MADVTRRLRGQARPRCTLPKHSADRPLLLFPEKTGYKNDGRNHVVLLWRPVGHFLTGDSSPFDAKHVRAREKKSCGRCCKEMQKTYVEVVRTGQDLSCRNQNGAWINLVRQSRHHKCEASQRHICWSSSLCTEQINARLLPSLALEVLEQACFDPVFVVR